jgi:hypothetical protein
MRRLRWGRQMPESPDNLLHRRLWYVQEHGQEHGPLTTAQVCHMCHDEGAYATLAVRPAGTGRWQWAGHFPELTRNGPRDDSPPTPQEVQAAEQWWERGLNQRAGRQGMIFFGILLTILLLIAGDFTAMKLGARGLAFLGWSSCLCTVAGWFGGLIALGWLPSRWRRLFRLPAAWCVLGLIGAGGLILMFVVISLAFAGALFLAC